eukprot:TRINITY_DN11531_c0_g1::TRINITY_DN11531_c0_g1_i1::g.22040::m.22040 TRINITY_DN11531_c0_g1::TRINITY_DN11531_c0_g1_i1::g.22040  ORF type:complete len:317 (+),score=62.37,sp/Q6TGY8/EMC2_DANRE/42.31/7e-62,TPR_14/PF13428.1/1.4e+02,TPR_14/PF13428.1/7.1e+02,TPR_14/PF13428.1/5.8,TPR_14/PF13428.1/0.0074,TPR_19/PF14559.1/4.1e+02,TPR_19/PF14559.1/51,TPR_19/PF14559.1/0.00014,TPR_19/PF14559.1/1.4e+04,TPR_16/PF13432.1/38,TPR_16/PF13432.1/3.5e+03,TPR_16/PF13432.1/0.015,TPR_16/PF13432.1/1.1,TPR_6/PF13174.1/1.1e+0
MVEVEYEDAEVQLQQLLAKKKPGFAELRDFLRACRRDNVRHSIYVSKFGGVLLNQYEGKLSKEERWGVYEQVSIAAMDSQNLTQADTLLKKLKKEFPISVRVKRLEALRRECCKDYQGAKTIYDEILKDDPLNQVILKRKVVLQKAQGRTSEAIAELNEYLQTYSADLSAWQELADLYNSIQAYKFSTFCYEELMLAAPNNHTWPCRYAEALYTVGGPENVLLSRRYFAVSLNSNLNQNPRALYGCFIASTGVMNSGKTKNDSDNQAVLKWSSENLTRLYEGKNPAMLPYVKAMIKVYSTVAASATTPSDKPVEKQ